MKILAYCSALVKIIVQSKGLLSSLSVTGGEQVHQVNLVMQPLSHADRNCNLSDATECSGKVVCWLSQRS